MKGKKRIGKGYIETTINEHGVVKQDYQAQWFDIDSEASYAKLYFEDILYLVNLPKGFVGVLMHLIKRMDYENTVFVNISIKQMIAEHLGYSVANVDKALKHFLKAGVIIRKMTGIYLMNPHLFGRGKWENIMSMRAEITWTPGKGREFKVDVIKGEAE